MYRYAVDTALCNKQPARNLYDEMKNSFCVIRDCAERTVGFKPKTIVSNFYNDPVVEELSDERKKLRIELQAYY